MTIASAIDNIITAQGGTPDPTDTIADSLVNLAGVLAGETIDKTETIEGAVRILGEHIGGGGGTEYAITCTVDGEASQSFVYKAVWNAVTADYNKDPDSPALDKAAAGDVLFVENPENRVVDVADANGYVFAAPSYNAIYMPPSAITVSAFED